MQFVKPIICSSLLLAFLIAGSCDTTGSDAPETFLRAVPDTDGSLEAAAWARAITEIGEEEGYLLAGRVPTEDGDLDVYVARLDAHGELMWKKTFGTRHKDEAYDLIRTREGNFVIAGTKRENLVYLLRIDAQGNLVEEHDYQREVEPKHMAEDEGFAITQTGDGGFAIVGRTSVPYCSSCSSAYFAPSVLRVDSEGKKLWFRHYYDGVGIGHALAIAQTSSGKFLVPGLYSAAWPLRITEDGTLVRPVKEGEFGIVYADIVALEDGTFLVAGAGFSSKIITVSKIRENGDRIWSNTYGHGSANSLTLTRDGGVVVAGSLLDQDTGERNIYLFKLDNEGEVVWETTREVVHKNAELLSVKETHTGAIVAAGQFRYPGGVAPLVLRAGANGRIDEVGPVLGYGLSEE